MRATQDQTLLKQPDLKYLNQAVEIRCWQLVIFPGGGPPSIFTAMSLFDRVRDGNGSFPHAWSPANLRFVLLAHSKLHNDYKLALSSTTFLFALPFIFAPVEFTS